MVYYRKYVIYSNSPVFGVYLNHYGKYGSGNNISYLLTDKDKSIIYVESGTTSTKVARIQLSVEYNDEIVERVELVADNSGKIFYELSDICKIYSGKIIGVNINIFLTSGAVYSAGFGVKIQQGYNFSRLCRLANVMGTNVNSNYTINGTSGVVSCNPIGVPEKFIFNREKNTGFASKFTGIVNIKFPFWTGYGNSNVQLNGVALSNTSSGLVSIPTTTAFPKFSELRVIGTQYSMCELVAMECGKKYIAVEWRTPYTFYGDSKTLSELALCFLEWYSEEIDVEQTEFDGVNFPVDAQCDTRIKCGIKDISAYDYVLYSQLFLAEEVSLYLDSASSTNKISAQVVAKKFTLPTSEGERYDFEIEFITNKI